ncbi:MAG: ATP-binding cassette domain-containing protein, partial [Bifidobacteriaceae bacterium]|nr:ATP-binding cassette domain-containing protein [Bifidobacteriaceae bacterium]
MRREALVATGLTVDYGVEVALRGVSVTLTPGEAPVGLIGPSGAGKTTLVRALMGWLRPGAGRVRWGGQDPARPGPRHKRQVAAALRAVREERDPAMEPRFPARRILDRADTLARRAGRDPGLTRTGLLDLVGLRAAELERLAGQLSLGERQRLAIAAAIATDPDILILDEPTTALDPALALDVLDAVAAHVAERETALLLVSHNMTIIERVTRSVICLVEGADVAHGPLDRVLAEAADPFLADLAGLRQAATTRPEAAPAVPESAAPDAPAEPDGAPDAQDAPDAPDGADAPDAPDGADGALVPEA